MSKYRTINLSLPDDLLKKVDAEARSDYANRSDFIRDTLVRRLKHQRVVDEWGDDGEWETVADFRTISPHCVDINDALKSLSNISK